MDRERERCPSACVEHAVIRDESGHEGRQLNRPKRGTERFKGGKWKSMLDGRHTMANNKASFCTFFLICSAFFLRVEKESGGVMNWPVWAA